jgi:hypothetical protein
MKTLFLSSALALSTLMTAQEVGATGADTTIVETAEEAAPTSEDLQNTSMDINWVIWRLQEGELSKEQAQAKMDSIIAELYLASDSFFANYVPDTVEEVLSWNDDFSAAYSGADSAQYPIEYVDTAFDDFDFLSFYEGTLEKTKVGVFEFQLGPNMMVLGDRSLAAAMDDVNGGLSWQSHVLFGQKRRIGGVKSPVQFETGFGLTSTTFSFKNDMTIDKDPMMFGATNLIPISGMSNVRRSNWSIGTFEIPAILHLDFSPKGTFNNGINIGFGIMGRMRYISQASFNGEDFDGDFYTESRVNGFHTRLLNYALIGQVGYKKLKVTGKLEQLPLFHTNYFLEEVYLGSITVGFSLN